MTPPPAERDELGSAQATLSRQQALHSKCEEAVKEIATSILTSLMNCQKVDVQTYLEHTITEEGSEELSKLDRRTQVFAKHILADLSKLLQMQPTGKMINVFNVLSGDETKAAKLIRSLAMPIIKRVIKELDRDIDHAVDEATREDLKAEHQVFLDFFNLK
jgi:hypothetical protein